MTQWPQNTTEITIIVNGAPVSVGNPIPISGSAANNQSVGATGATTPTYATLIGGSDGTNLQAALVQNNINPNLRAVLYNGAVLLIGQKTAANSLPVVLPSDVGIFGLSGTVLSVASAAQSSYTSADLTVTNYSQLILDVNVTAITGGSSPTVTFRTDRKDAQGIYYPVDTPPTLSAAGSISRSIGVGLAQNVSFGNTVRIVMVVTGAPTSVTFSLSLLGRY